MRISLSRRVTAVVAAVGLALVAVPASTANADGQRRWLSGLVWSRSTELFCTGALSGSLGDSMYQIRMPAKFNGNQGYALAGTGSVAEGVARLPHQYINGGGISRCRQLNGIGKQPREDRRLMDAIAVCLHDRDHDARCWSQAISPKIGNLGAVASGQATVSSAGWIRLRVGSAEVIGSLLNQG